MLSTRRFSTYVQGMKNIAWVSGFARKFGTEDGLLTGLMQVSNGSKGMLPVKARRSKVKAPVNREPCKVTGRIYGELITWNDGEKDIEVPSAYLQPLEIGRPNILEMSFEVAWGSLSSVRKQDGAGEDDFKPYGSSMAERPRDAANMVLLAGIVDGVSGILSRTGSSVVGVEILLRQHSDRRRNIPVRVMNSGIAHQVCKDLRMGQPIYIEGKLRVRDLARIGEDGMEVPSGVQVGYVWCKDIQNARRDRDILEIPGWIAGVSASEPEEESQDADGVRYAESPAVDNSIDGISLECEYSSHDMGS